MMDDKMKMFDTCDVAGQFYTSEHNTRMIGEVTIERNILGKKMIEVQYNDIVMTGSTYVLERMTGIRSSLGITTLSQDLDILGSVTPNTTNLKEEAIIGFMCGIGGAGAVPGSVNAVTYTDKELNTTIPIRVTTAELTGTEAAPYFMKKLVGGKYHYYGKKHTGSPVIRHLFTDGTEVPTNVASVGATQGIRVFAEYVLDINEKDIREYFMDTDGNLNNSRINTIGLITGFPSGSDYAGVRLTTALNFKASDLDNNENTVRFTYRIYCI